LSYKIDVEKVARKGERAVAMVGFLQPTLETSPARQHDPFSQNNPEKRAFSLFHYFFLSIHFQHGSHQANVRCNEFDQSPSMYVLTMNEFTAPARAPEAKLLANSSPPRRPASPPRPRVVSRSPIVTVRVPSPCARFVGTKSRPTC
jgi:hypothetical protein